METSQTQQSHDTANHENLHKTIATKLTEYVCATFFF